MKLTFTKGSQKIVIDDKGKGINGILTTDKSKTDYPQIKLTKGTVTKYFQTKWGTHNLTVGYARNAWGFNLYGWSDGHPYGDKFGSISPTNIGGKSINEISLLFSDSGGTSIFRIIGPKASISSKGYNVAIGGKTYALTIYEKFDSSKNLYSTSIEFRNSSDVKALKDYLISNKNKSINITITPR